jgi:hypothetical protein
VSVLYFSASADRLVRVVMSLSPGLNRLRGSFD